MAMNNLLFLKHVQFCSGKIVSVVKISILASIYSGCVSQVKYEKLP